jgi:hypothetical protein
MIYCAKKRFLGGTRMELTEEVKALLLNTAKELKGIETQLQRLPHLNKWFVDIGDPSPVLWEHYSCLSS